MCVIVGEVFGFLLINFYFLGNRGFSLGFFDLVVQFVFGVYD